MKRSWTERSAEGKGGWGGGIRRRIVNRFPGESEHNLSA